MRLTLKHQILLAPASVLLLMSLALGFLQHSYWGLSIKRQKAHDLGSAFIALAQADLNAARMQSLARRFQSQPLVDIAELRLMSELSNNLLESLQHVIHASPLPHESEALIQQSMEYLDPEHAYDPDRVLDNIAILRSHLVKLVENIQRQRKELLEGPNPDIDQIVHQTTLVSIIILATAILLGLLLALFFSRRILRRISALSTSAGRIAAGELEPPPAPEQINDELDHLALSINSMTERLIRVVSAEKLLEGAEEERRRIAMDLHDQTLSDLAQLQRGLQELKIQEDQEEKQHALLQELQQAMSSLREVMENLHPQTLEILGLGAAITAHIERLHARPGMPEYNLYIAPTVENAGISRLTKLTLYRISIEAVHNILKHAHASRYELALEVREGELILTVEDNGQGMPKTPVHKESGRGLHNMRERARAIGATVNWHASRFSTGTCFELRLPLAKPDEENRT
ncbi:MAG: hypothetical protein C0624_14920 [Desulfuromonas sp.]|nr:MAG: hypothetical protein C0624_14920 [Desulfuromonas sp.]